ncbi:LPXTG cell wall anchor domain-containing protein [Enterococcus faecalis]|uniref:LPXTG cell wall anchor domain-containing protein n=1 Tax=Enterococcus faecalis TaxID=1351 RepID=UPI00132FF5D8|nr:LPXTG cell wall anchor domain-containing protein [Enterococcus faecalis]
MKRRNLQFLLLLVLIIYIPQTTYAENRETTEVGIGFTKTSDIPSKKNPAVNVLPQTTIQSLSIVRNRTQVKRFPKTGDKRINGLSWLGILFLISSFWMFLFRQLVEKENNYE